MDDDEAAPPEELSEDMAPAREPVTLEAAAGWLATIKSAPLLALLRDPDFALVSMTAFVGFRVNPTGCANPLVRGRLAREAVRDDKFGDKLRELAEETPILATEAGTKATDTKPAASIPNTKEANTAHRLAALRAERDLRRRERNEARQALVDSGAALVEAEHLLHQREAERDEFHAQAQRQTQRIARLERQVIKLKAEQATLVQALRQQQTMGISQTPAARDDTPQTAPPSGPGDAPDLWQAAVTHLLDKRRFDLALSLAEDVLRADPNNIGALDIAARTYEGKDDARGAIPFLRRSLLASRPQNPEGVVEILRRLLLTAPASEIERDLRHFLSLLHSDNQRQIEMARAMLVRMRGLAPETHTHVAALITRIGPSSLTNALLPPPGQLGSDDPLPLSAAWTPSARHLLQAVLSGDVDTVGRAQDALARLSLSSPEIRQRIETALTRAADEEAYALTPLLQKSRPRGPVLVDGSNAAWHGQDTLTAPRPRLRPLLELRRTLLARGFFPVWIWGDAPLLFTIDEPDTLRRMTARHEITLVDSGVDADEVLLREAKRADAPLVTNDYMADWDPQGEVEKIGYTFSLHGEAYLT